MANEITLWKSANVPVLPAKIDVPDMVSRSVQLSVKDQTQIVKAFEDGSFEMVSSYIWTKAINALRGQLGKMGISFIAEMLERPDINENTNIQQAISDFEAIRLAEELGVISGTSAFRLKKTMDTIAHFNQPDLGDDEENDLSEEETKTIIRSCVQGVLGYSKIEAALDFKNFRIRLEDSTLHDESPDVIKLIQSPYFFHRTTLRILISIIKGASGAQLENSLANANLIIPKIWGNLQHPEKYQVGRSYSELFADGKSKAASGLKQVLLKVNGFDFVPEDLRSSQFVKAANDILFAHENIDNFYNEPGPMITLSRMGSVIPIPAFPLCITATLCVRLGNYYGRARNAQDSALNVIKSVSNDRWIYFFNECFVGNQRILYKLTEYRPLDNWLSLFSSRLLEAILPEITNKDAKKIVQYTRNGQGEKIRTLAGEMYSKLGYTNS